ncbi:MAG: hypothetical protein L0Z55_12925 [Planctomycetes bacterium]|nr:hypothetical protein [Planctomycetota bacterium]
MTPLRGTLLACALAAFGCAGGAPRAATLPHYYAAWEALPPELAADADHARARLAASDFDAGALQDYARATARLARWQAAEWLELAASERDRGATGNERQRSARRRLLDGARHALALYREMQMRGAKLDSRARIEMAWLLFLTGADADGEEMLAAALADPGLDPSGRAAIAALAAEVEALPPERAP